MPHVKLKARYVVVAYELCCGFERATALADDVTRVFKSDSGFCSAEDDTRGWDGDRLSVIKVTYNSLMDAVRLDDEIRRWLGRNVEFTCVLHDSVGYSRHGGELVVTASTTCRPRV